MAVSHHATVRREYGAAPRVRAEEGQLARVFMNLLINRAPHVAARIVFLTGGAFSPRSEEFLRKNTNLCLAKPFSQATVSSVVRRMMQLQPQP